MQWKPSCFMQTDRRRAGGQTDRETEMKKLKVVFAIFRTRLKTEIFALLGCCVANQHRISKIYKKTRKLSEKLCIITTGINYLHVWCWLFFVFFPQVAFSKTSRKIQINEEDFMRCCFASVIDDGNLALPCNVFFTFANLDNTMGARNITL